MGVKQRRIKRSNPKVYKMKNKQKFINGQNTEKKLRNKLGKNEGSDEEFWKTAQQCSDTVKTWPKWMQRIKITAETANTGNFIEDEEEN